MGPTFSSYSQIPKEITGTVTVREVSLPRRVEAGHGRSSDGLEFNLGTSQRELQDEYSFKKQVWLQPSGSCCELVALVR